MSPRILPRIEPNPLGALLRRDRLVTLAGLFTLIALAWSYVTHLASAMGRMEGAMVMPQAHPWDTGEIVWLFTMWAVMMIAMMLPSAAPVILLFTTMARRRRLLGTPSASPAIFVLGYLLTWVGYSALAALTQSALHSHALLSPSMTSASPLLGASLLVAAGAYQWLPVKQQCLVRCRSSIGFFTAEWREGVSGALLMGLRHGSFCVGCCWLLMALLFVAGVMNLLWVAILALVVLIEKAAPAGRLFGRLTGVALIGWGVWLLLAKH